VVWIVLVRHTARRNHLFALGALGREELLITSDAVVVFVLRDEALRPQSLLAVVAGEAILVPLLAFVLHLLGARGLVKLLHSFSAAHADDFVLVDWNRHRDGERLSAPGHFEWICCEKRIENFKQIETTQL